MGFNSVFKGLKDLSPELSVTMCRVFTAHSRRRPVIINYFACHLSIVSGFNGTKINNTTYIVTQTEYEPGKSMGTGRMTGFDSRQNHKTKKTDEVNWYNLVEKDQRLDTETRALNLCLESVASISFLKRKWSKCIPQTAHTFRKTSRFQRLRQKI